jgi:hypothetical protein
MKIIQIAVSDTIYALTDDGGVYCLVPSVVPGEYRWLKLPDLTEVK